MKDKMRTIRATADLQHSIFGHGKRTDADNYGNLNITKRIEISTAECAFGMNIFYSLLEAQILIEQWRKHYNTKRPHSALGYRPPAPEIVFPMDQRPVMQ